jgi:hypothetical protein
MRAIDKQSPSATSSRAADFVQANIEFEITATMIVQLPSYPNRFVKPKFYNTSLENAVQGIGLYPEYGDKVVTFNLLRSVATAPTRNAVDQTENNEPTEDNMVPVVANVTRPRRSLPRIVALKKKAK